MTITYLRQIFLLIGVIGPQVGSRDLRSPPVLIFSIINFQQLHQHPLQQAAMTTVRVRAKKMDPQQRVVVKQMVTFT